MKEVRIFLDEDDIQWFKFNAIQMTKYFQKCVHRARSDAASPEAFIAEYCKGNKPTKGEQKVECSVCKGEGLRRAFEYTTSGLICRECFREKDFELTVRKMEVDSIKNSSEWRDR